MTRDEDVASVVSFVDSLRTEGKIMRGGFSNAGVDSGAPDMSAEGCPVSALDRVMQINYLGAVRFIQGFLPAARADRSTIVVNSAG